MHIIQVFRPEVAEYDGSEWVPFSGIETVYVQQEAMSEDESMRIVDNFKDECLRFHKQDVINRWHFHIDTSA